MQAHRGTGSAVKAGGAKWAAPCRHRAVLPPSHAVKKSSGKQVCKTSTLVAKEGQEAQVARLVGQVTSWSLEQPRQSGIVVFESVRDAWEPTTFHTWERYESSGAMGRHTTSPTYQQFMEQVNPLLEGPIAMALYEWKDGALGPACMSVGPKGEGGLDDATGATGAAGGASLKQTSDTFNLSFDQEPALMDDDFLSSSLNKAKKQMDGLKGMLGGLFKGGKK